MTVHNELTLTLHGLDHENGQVRADTFSRKMRMILLALEEIDRHANGRKHFNYLISDLSTNCAQVVFCETLTRKSQPKASSINELAEVSIAFYNGSPAVRKYPERLVKRLGAFANGSNKNFSHAEISFGKEDVLRIDDYWEKQAEKYKKGIEKSKTGQNYQGTAIGTFDGVLKQVDSRGAVVRGKLLLSGSRAEIDCVMSRNDIPQIRDCWEKRARVTGVAHYSSESQIPNRLDVREISISPKKADIRKWRGQLTKTDEIENWVDDEG